MQDRTNAATECNSHRWIIDTPNGHKTSLGTCRSCGSTRRFPNAYADISEGERALPPEVRRRLRGAGGGS